VPLQVLGAGRELVCDAALLARRYGLAHGGAVLVRPDGHVAWTCTRAVEPIAQLLAALDLTSAGSATSRSPRPRSANVHPAVVRSAEGCS
jgi:hypothetical protein